MAREQRSLFGEILDWMLAPLLLLWPISVGLTWLVAQDIANRPFDRELAAMARAISNRAVVGAASGAAASDAATDARGLAEGTSSAATAAGERDMFGVASDVVTLPPGSTDVLHSDEADSIFYQLRDVHDKVLSGERFLPAAPDDDQQKAGEVRFRDALLHDTAVRIAYLRFTPKNAPAGMLVTTQVAETTGKRSRLASEIIKGVILPQFVILPLAVLLVWLALARGIAPLNELQRRIRSRDSHDLSPIDELDAPEEVSPLVRAINDLLARLDQSITAQKHFLADAAHQLKTPLAGLRTQAELAQREIDAGQTDPQALKKSLQQIARSSQRAAHMVNQLLSMARAEDKEYAAARVPVNIARLASEAVQDSFPRALEKRIDLGYEPPHEIESNQRLPLVGGQPLMLGELIRNLVDNAINYTPAGGTVTVRVVAPPDADWLELQVEDSGPGIPVGERELVYQPFYRALGTNVDGSGLGLAIVREIAQQHDAVITIEDANLSARARSDAATDVSTLAAYLPGPGARFTVRFAANTSAPAGAAAST